MGLEIKIEENGAGVVFTFDGVLNGEDIFTASKALYTPEKLQKLRYQLVDLRSVHRIELSTEQIKRLADLDRKAAHQAGGFKIASIVDHGLQESISQFYRAYVEDPLIEAKIFRSMDDARTWINEAFLEENNYLIPS